MRIFLSFIFLFSLQIHGQTVSGIDVPINAKTPSDFVPKGWKIHTDGHYLLNQDSLKDHVLILSQAGEDSLSTSEKPCKRIFLVLLAQQDQTFRNVIRNENVIYHYNYDLNFKEAFVGLRFAKGKIHIDHYGGFATRWGRTSTFTFSEKEKTWFLTQDEFTTFQSTDPENTEKTIIKTRKDFGKIPLGKFDIYKSL